MMYAVVFPMFLDGMKKAKKSEAAIQLKKIGDKAKEDWATRSALPPKAAPLTPATPCCTQDFDNRRRCAVQNSDWDTPAWRDLDFAMDEDFLYQYSYTPTKNGFVATAVGDLDCDGTTIEYKLEGRVVNGKLETTLTEPPPNSD